jgi:hypothetical protein
MKFYGHFKNEFTYAKWGHLKAKYNHLYIFGRIHKTSLSVSLKNGHKIESVNDLHNNVTARFQHFNTNMLNTDI